MINDWADLLGHLTYLLIALSFLVRDMLWLRILAVVASVFSIGFQVWKPSFVGGEVHWVIVFWNCVFIGINGVRIGLLIKERLDCRFDDLETELKETVFRALAPVEFMKLMRVAVWENLPPGAELTRQGEEVDSLILVYSGEADVEVGGVKHAECIDGDFIGEMSFTTSGPASATVRAASDPLRVVRWPKADLRKVLERNPNLALSLQAVLGTDMARKLHQTKRRTRGDLKR